MRMDKIQDSTVANYDKFWFIASDAFSDSEIEELRQNFQTIVFNSNSLEQVGVRAFT